MFLSLSPPPLLLHHCSTSRGCRQKNKFLKKIKKKKKPSRIVSICEYSVSIFPFFSIVSALFFLFFSSLTLSRTLRFFSGMFFSSLTFFFGDGFFFFLRKKNTFYVYDQMPLRSYYLSFPILMLYSMWVFYMFLRSASNEAVLFLCFLEQIWCS